MQRTLIIIKPDAITRGIAGEITQRFEKKWLKLVWAKMEVLKEEALQEHYYHLSDKPFFKDIISYMTSSPVLLQVWEWVEVVDVVRLMIWVTNSRQAQPGTIRGDFGICIWRNVVHASESDEAARTEIERFFDESELYDYKRADEDKLYEDR